MRRLKQINDDRCAKLIHANKSTLRRFRIHPTHARIQLSVKFTRREKKITDYPLRHIILFFQLPSRGHIDCK
jgi:hypothetical protein